MNAPTSHIHVSIRDKTGRNIFALSDEQIKAGGRKDAQWKDTQYISQKAEWFLAGILNGLPDGRFPQPCLLPYSTLTRLAPTSYASTVP